MCYSICIKYQNNEITLKNPIKVLRLVVQGSNYSACIFLAVTLTHLLKYQVAQGTVTIISKFPPQFSRYCYRQFLQCIMSELWLISLLISLHWLNHALKRKFIEKIIFKFTEKMAFKSVQKFLLPGVGLFLVLFFEN